MYQSQNKYRKSLARILFLFICVIVVLILFIFRFKRVANESDIIDYQYSLNVTKNWRYVNTSVGSAVSNRTLLKGLNDTHKNGAIESTTSELMNTSPSVTKDLERRDPKYVLYWTKMFNKVDFYYGFGKKPFEHCEYKNCFTTADRNLLKLEDFDALMFFGPFYNLHKGNVPHQRSAHQRYIYFNLESPLTYPKDMRPFKNFYNWTMTYRLDSDIPNPYGSLVRSKKDFKMPTKSELKKKKRLIAWFVSKCNVPSKRREFVEEMMKYVKVDIYGRCGNLTCDQSLNCYGMLERNYKFYLSFENSYCKDYVTEKMYHVLQKNVVPVVYGGADYNKLAPPHSVINVEDFSSVEVLVHYLDYLDKNDDKYLEYFNWKTDYYVISSFTYHVCSLCKKLHTDTIPKVYENIHGWLHGEDGESVCKTNENLPKVVITALSSN